MKFDYRTERHENTVLICTNNWIQNDSNKIQKYRLSGRDVVTYITKAIDTYVTQENLKGYISTGDTVLLTRVVSDVAQYRGFLGIEGNTYFPVPFMQVIATFRNGIISLDTMNVLFDKIIYKKVSPDSTSVIKDIEGINNIGQIVKIGTNSFNEDYKVKPLQVKKGDYIIVKDNVSTEIMIDGELYYAIEEGSILGVFKDFNSSSLGNVKFINRTILMSPYIPEKMSKNSILWTPNINYEDLDYSEIYCRNQFKVNYADTNLTKIKKDDIVLIDRNVTTYFYFKNKKYFVTNGIDYIEGRRI